MSLLADLVRRQTATSTLSVFTRMVDKVAESLAEELLRDVAFRTQMRELVKTAFEQALRELQQPAPPPPGGNATSS